MSFALIETLQDNFSDGRRDSSKWAAYGGGDVTETLGALWITDTTTAGYMGYYGVQQYDGTGSYSFIQITNTGDQSQTSFGAFFQWNDYTTSDQVGFDVSNGLLRAAKNISSVYTVLASTTYNSVTHKYIRIRESGGTTYWDFSSDGTTWNNLHSAPNPITVTKIFIGISAGTYSDEGITTSAAFKGFNISPSDTTLETLSDSRVRSVAESLQVSWKKDYISTINVFTIGSSSIGGNDIIGGNTTSLASWNKYQFSDESAYLNQIEWEQQLNMPIGGLSIGLASANLDNTSGRFTPKIMGGSSAIFTAIEPRKPFIINAGFEDNEVGYYEPQFVGELSRTPRVSLSDASVQLQGEDFITYLKNKRIDNTAMFTGLSSSTIMERILNTHLGLSTAQYELEQGMNTIDFSMIESGTNFFDYFQQLAQAEMAQFFQDESGILKFWNRQHWDNAEYSSPRYILATSEVMEAQMPDDDTIINVVEVKANPRVKQTTTIFTLNGTVELSPGDNDFWVDFDNPVLVANTPSKTANTLEDGTGTNVSSSVLIKSTDVFAKSAKYVLNNTTGATAYITAFTISGRWAIPRYDTPITRTTTDQSSVTAYDEKSIQIENDYIQDATWAESFGQMVVNRYAEPGNLQNITVRAKPFLHFGDSISWQGHDWIIFNLKNKISSGDGYIQELSLIKKFNESYFKIGISTIGGADQIAA